MRRTSVQLLVFLILHFLYIYFFNFTSAPCLSSSSLPSSFVVYPLLHFLLLLSILFFTSFFICCLSSSSLPSSFVIYPLLHFLLHLLSIYPIATEEDNFCESLRVLLFPCFKSYWRVHFPRSVLTIKALKREKINNSNKQNEIKTKVKGPGV